MAIKTKDFLFLLFPVFVQKNHYHLMWINHIHDKKDFFAFWAKKSVLKY